MPKPFAAPFPLSRPRRLRRTPALRAMTRETAMTPDNLIWPIFLQKGRNEQSAIASMPGVSRLTVDRAVTAAREAHSLGIPAMCLFPYTGPESRTEDCAEAWSDDNLTNTAIRAIKDAVPEMALMTDIALDPYNINGHDGYVVDGEIVNDPTVEALVKMAMAQARAGADILGPSDMMDGRIGAIRAALESEGQGHVAILSYAAKFASAFYGPFRDAVGASGAFKGDKKTYQIDPANAEEALRMVGRDLAEGADMVMVKPGMSYLDICHRVKDAFEVPTFAYQVSGEYAMIEGAARNGWLDGDRVMMESLMAFRRAGCDGVLTYFAPRAARIMAG
ncbi:MAG: porphobilinogen synthase [Limimaricola cinnabarinus]|jgi:porphobilinogen synthase|uniref:porphobilinogen synthase n=1 Tax=Limimaricola cinnabarinus TaxID=1125964 RepID=UPI0039E6A30A